MTPQPDRGQALIARDPFRVALTLALIYLAVCAIYIVVSDQLVAQLATASEHYQSLQTIKGLLFVALTSALIFVLSLLLLRRIARDQRQLLNHQQALVASERRAAAGLLANAVAHDMNNVLTVGMANVELLRSHATLDAAGSDMLRDIGLSFERMHDLTRRMSRTGQHRSEAVKPDADLADIVRREIRFMHRHQSAQHCQIDYAGPDHHRMPLHDAAIRELLENLLLNAAEATQGRGRIDVRILSGPEEVVLEVHDNGPGIPKDRRLQVFEPLFTTKPNGMGLGLLSVKAAVKKHMGRVDVTDSPLGGACFRVILPLTAHTA